MFQNTESHIEKKMSGCAFVWTADEAETSHTACVKTNAKKVFKLREKYRF